MTFFYQSIVFSFHTWLAILIAVLAAAEIIPDLGVMKRYQEQAQKGEIRALEEDESSMDVMGGEDVKADFGAFFVPLAGLIIGMLVFSLAAGEVVMIPGAIIGCISGVVYTGIRGSIKSRIWEIC